MYCSNMKNISDSRPVFFVPPGMGDWVKSEAKKLGLSFIGVVREVAPDAPGHDFDEEVEILPPSITPHLRLV